MIKRTLYFGNPAYLKTRLNQLIIEQEDKEVMIYVNTLLSYAMQLKDWEELIQ